MANLLLDIAKSIIWNHEFKIIFDQLYKFNLLSDLRNDTKDQDFKVYLTEELYSVIINDSQIKKIIDATSIFTSIKSEDSLEEDNIKNIAYIILCGLNNYVNFYKLPYYKKIIFTLFTKLWLITPRDKFIKTDFGNLSIWVKIGIMEKELFHKFILKDSLEEIYLTKFQINILDILDGPEKVVAISWPTSAWKNFVVSIYICKLLLNSEEKLNICIIVPSKALISESFIAYKKEFKKYKIEANIITFGDVDLFDITKSEAAHNIFILTQERLSYFYQNLKEKYSNLNFFSIDLLVIDEAYKIGYSNRGVLLNYIVSNLYSQNKIKKIVLLWPLIKQLGFFKRILGINEIIKEVYSEFNSVFQNKIYIEEWYKTQQKKFVYLDYITKEKKILFEYNKLFPTSREYKDKISKLVSLLWSKSTIIYRNNPSSTRIQAKAVWKYFEETDENEKNNKALIDYIEEVLWDTNELISLLKKGIAFHNWQLPISVRNKIEENFRKWYINILCANKTLIEWVNLPCKYLFIGDDAKKLWKLDFNNLCGRVWRYNYHLYGNILLINPDEYINLLDYYSNNKIIDIQPESAINSILDWNTVSGKSKKEEFLDYLTSSNYQKYNDDNNDYEYLTWFLFYLFINKSSEDFSLYIKVNTSFTDDYIDLLYEKLWIIYNDYFIAIDDELKKTFEKNLFIDPRKQMDLYEGIERWDHEFIDLPHPNHQEYYNKLTVFNKQVWQYFLKLSRNTTTDSEYYKLNNLMYKWIYERNLIELFHTKVNWEIQTPEIIFKYIDTDICFKYLNAVNAYIDIANYCLRKKLQEWEYLVTPQISKDIISYIEYWAHSSIMIYLLSKWLYRDSAIVLKWILYKLWLSLYDNFDKIDVFIKRNHKKIRNQINNSILLEEFNKLI